MGQQSTSSKTSVVIIGAGPTGLSMAIQLLRYNINFIILEKNEKTTLLSKALVVQARTLEIFQEIGLAQKAVNEGRITTGVNLFYKGKKRTSINLSGIGKGLSAFPFTLSLEQSKTEKLLVDYLTEHGTTIQWLCEFSHFEQNENGVSVYYKDQNGVQQVIRAEYMVGCDGAHSPVRHQLGSSFEGSTVPKLFYVTDVTLSSTVINKDELFIFLVKNGFAIFFPMEGVGHYRIVGILPGKIPDENITFKEVESIIKPQLQTPVEFKEVRWFSTYKVNSRKGGSFMNGRCFIAGDAAHIHTPAGGQGMNTGIQDAYNLAWKLAYVITQKANPSLLETYNSERIENARHLLRTTDRMFDIMAGSNPFWNFIRLSIIPLAANFVFKNSTLNKKIFPLLSQIGIAYPNSSLTVPSAIGKIKAGERMPYFIFSNGKKIFEYLAAPAFKILYFGSGNSYIQTHEIKFKISTFSFCEIPRNLFNDAVDFYIFLRPDNYIVYIGKTPDEGLSLLKKL